jgi:hypothetical protein
LRIRTKYQELIREQIKPFDKNNRLKLWNRSKEMHC